MCRVEIRVALNLTTSMLTPLAPHSHTWGQRTLNLSSLPPKRDWGPKRVNIRNFCELRIRHVK